MATTLDGNRLQNIKVTGKGLNADLVESCIGASFSISSSQVTGMTLRFLDNNDLSVFKSGVLAAGASVNYGGWNMVASGISVQGGKTGPELSVTASSLFVERLKAQTGGHSWGERDVSAWAMDVGRSVGMTPVVQPGLGVRALARAASDGDRKESTWDVLATAAKNVGAWLFEYGPYLIMARPSWLIKQPWGQRQWDFYWASTVDYSQGLAGLPKYSNNPNSNPVEQITFSLVSADADSIRTGDSVSFNGPGGMFGNWLVEGVGFPMNVSGVVSVSCVRPIDPVIPPPTATATTAVAGAPKQATGAAASSSKFAAVLAFINGLNGRAIDVDGAYGAQCVDLVSYYNTQWVGGANIFGNGNQWFNSPTAAGAYIRVGADQPTQPGDIPCWNSFYGGGYGHVAITIADAGGSIKCLTQNPGPANITTLSKQGLQGYLRPRKLA